VKNNAVKIIIYFRFAIVLQIKKEGKAIAVTGRGGR
jgi:hypothetical protein